MRFVLLVLLAVLPVAAHAQLAFGADLVSRYVWRGYDFGESASIQPSIAYTTAGTTIGTWASYSLTPESALANEHDFSIAHAFPIGGSTLTVGVQDYYFPNAGADIFDLDDDGDGAHYIEPSVLYTGDPSLPITLFAAVVAYNDPDHSLYVEAGYPVTVAGTLITPSVGVVPYESEFYGTTGAALTNVSLRVWRAVPITEHFSIPLWVQATLNPYEERSFLVFGMRVGV